MAYDFARTPHFGILSKLITPSVPRGISTADSFVLDLFRGGAAAMVLIYHWSLPNFCNTGTTLFGAFGHSGVLIFFVLSGYVIAAMTDTKETKPSDYFLARASRMFSVVIPVLALVLLIDWIAYYSSGGQTTPPPGLIETARQIGISLIFANEWWAAGVPALSDGPYWSLSYEVSYYAL